MSSQTTTISIFREPRTDTERVVRDACSFVLQVPVTNINLDRSFVANGGDSIAAMRVSPRCRNSHVVVSVARLLTAKTLADVTAQSCLDNAKVLLSAVGDDDTWDKKATDAVSSESEIEPFSLLNISENELSDLRAQIAPALRIPPEQVRDIAPTTHTQSLCVEAAMHTPPQGCYVFYIDIPQSIELKKMTTFAQKLWDRVDMLRTVFVLRPESSQLLQVVSEQSVVPLELYAVNDSNKMESESKRVFEESLKSSLESGAIYVKFMLLHRPDTPTRLAIRLSHAHYDGMSLPPILECLAAELQGKLWPAIPSFVSYISHVCEQSGNTLQYWKKALHGSKPLALHPTGNSSQILTRSRVIACPPKQASFTEANVFLAVCAETLARLYDTRDVHFTLTVSGRAMLPANLTNIVGPCLNQVPLRVVLPEEPNFSTTVGLVRKAQLDMLPAEMATLQDIYKACTDWPEGAQKMAYNVHFNDLDSRSIDLLGDGAQVPLLVHGPRGVWEHSEQIWIIASPVEGTWQIALSANASHCTADYLDKIGDTLALVAAAAQT
ncbi:hypothetical protein BB8028_0011g00060 [Beauveria bassiana]|uniref:Carrier domain-containing protein n=1 Tax=Beauveria bassiana TaxID=176275 RepID=A0A2S7YPT5_BEABA|nr:hypothetical protein BB8028_0011g00060 [Beauveria bassiana]